MIQQIFKTGLGLAFFVTILFGFSNDLQAIPDVKNPSRPPADILPDNTPPWRHPGQRRTIQNNNKTLECYDDFTGTWKTIGSPDEERFIRLASSQRHPKVGRINDDTPPIDGWQRISTVEYTNGQIAKVLKVRVIGNEVNIYFRKAPGKKPIHLLSAYHDVVQCKYVLLYPDENGEFEWYVHKTEPPTHGAWIDLVAWTDYLGNKHFVDSKNEIP